MARKRLKLLILGASGFGREVLWTASDVPEEQRNWEVDGFLDDDLENVRTELRAKQCHTPVRGTIRDYHPSPGEVLVCAIRTPRVKLAVCDELRARGALFTNVVHPTALVHSSAELGTGIILRHYSGISPNSRVGNDVMVNSSAGPAHDTVIGDGCSLGAHSDVLGGAHLGRGVSIGSHAVVMPSARVGDFAVVGVGSVVLRRVAPGTTVFGVPAKRLDFGFGG